MYIKFNLKKYRVVMLMTQSDVKIKEKLTCSSKYDMKNFANFYPATQMSKNFTLMGYFCLKYIKFELRNYLRVIFHDIEQ